MNQNQIKQVLDEFPEEVDVEGFLERIDLFRRIEIAENQIAEGNVYTHEEVKEQLKSWLE